MRKRGMALITVLSLTAVLLMIVAGLVARTRTGAGFQLEGQADLAALYAAEAGVAEALSRWSEDATKTWSGDLVDQPVQGGEGRFTLRFSNGSCVNNLNQDAAADGPMGAGSVAPRSAFLTVVGEARGRRRQVEVIVARTGLVGSPIALLASDQIALEGNVTVMGLRSLQDATEIPAEVISLAEGTGTDRIRWNGAGSANIHGSLLSNAATTGAISGFSGANITGSSLTAQQRTRPLRPDISGRISAHAGDTPLPPLVGNAMTLSGDMYRGGNVNYNGDLVLDNCNLYVTGNLTLNGAIRGKGSVFVAGNSTLMGDSEIRAHDNGVALFSKGNVT